MPKNLDFSTLVPERDTFTDSTGAKHEFKARVDFGAVDLARVNRLHREIKDALKALGDKPEDEAGAVQLEQCATDFVRLILPTLPDERLGAISLGQKNAIVEWWTDRQKGDDAGEASANQSKS